MREIRIEKVTVNIGTGEPGEKLERAKKLLETLTNRKAVLTRTAKRSTFGVAKGRTIGCKVTLRKGEALEFLKRVLDAVENKIKENSFDTQGNFSFGIKEHIDIPGVEYDPDIGIYGMDVCVTLERRGFRIKKKRNPSKVGKSHLITIDKAREWVSKTFGVEIV
jgi:large subunit ribosomal protein L5